MKPEAPELCTQLQILNERIRMYAARVWQLPMTYLSVVAVTAFNIEKVPERLFASIFLIVTGILVGVILASYRNRINGLVRDTIKVEEALCLPVSSVKEMSVLSFCLYLMIILGGLGVAISFIPIN